ncbi:MAG: OmpA family protein [Guyparkeria sp.]
MTGEGFYVDGSHDMNCCRRQAKVNSGGTKEMRAVGLKSIAMLIGVFALSLQTAIAAGLPFPDLEVELAELDSDHLRLGRDHATLGLERVGPGLSRQEVEEWLGSPVSRDPQEGLMHWQYNVHFPVAGGTSELVCQYMVVFGADEVVSSTHWRRRFCETLYQSRVVDIPSEDVEVVTLSADVLFGFGEAELTREGQEELRRVAEQLKAKYEDAVITLVGHTDRIGSDEFNLKLSQRRAEAVRRQLTGYGLPSDSMVAEGRGETEPVVSCRTDDLEDLKECLKPNRRVEIEVFERQ